MWVKRLEFEQLKARVNALELDERYIRVPYPGSFSDRWGESERAHVCVVVQQLVDKLGLTRIYKSSRPEYTLKTKLR